MSRYPQFIDNSRKKLSDVIREIAPNYDTLSIASGYWDLAGTLEIIEQIESYQSVRLLIGKEPIAHRLQEKYHININSPENLFPDADIKHDLERDSNSEELDQLRGTVRKLVQMIKEGRLEVKLFREPRLHAKAYIFGNLGLGNSIGIVGSSNFTKAGLTSNSELNFLTDEYKIVEFVPQTENQENGHLTWFNDLWLNESAIDWTGDFTELLVDSPLGDRTFGQYDTYIKTLMEVFPDELIETEPFSKEVQDILHPFQNQNALSLRRKLQNMGVAMLSDSVGLGKTVTASAVINQFLIDGYRNVVILPPAALKRQWIDELQGERWNLISGRDFRVISQQDMIKIQELIDFARERRSLNNEIDLFVIDEAHNLRNQGSARYQQFLELFQENPNARVLLLTATPINNSLMDFASQIQLGSKGDLISRNVPYTGGKEGKLEYIDFFEALKRITSAATRAERRGEVFDWEQHKNTLVTGLRHYLVRSTRQGVEKRNAMKASNDLERNTFPNSKVKQFTYGYTNDDQNFINKKIKRESQTVFEGINPNELNIDLISEITQRTSHPLDFIKAISDLQMAGHFESVIAKYNLSEAYNNIEIKLDDMKEKSIVPAVFKIINFLGFTPYKPDTYAHEIYGKSISEIRLLNLKGKTANKLRIQLAIHNMLHVTWLKRLESSTATLLKSVQNYIARINLFEKWLDKGFIVSLTDASLLAKEYDEDIEKAFDDYEIYLQELDESIHNGTESEVKKRGIERKVASEETHNLYQLRKDLNRDKLICNFLVSILSLLSGKGHDRKLEIFADELIKTIDSGKYGKKVLVFSFFSDTIDYLRENLPTVLEDRIPNFSQQAEFISGQSANVDDVAKRFSPNSKGYKLKGNIKELNFLFATDVLSEGQNLQDAGILVNYDLHWNPVRMIQRNGRINRLGSAFNEVLIANARPHDDLELYLKLVRRLENKIETINNTVGNDQSVLGEKENPIEFNDLVQEDYGIYSNDSNKATAAMNDLENQGDVLDWMDSYSFELREFLDIHKNDGEIERIKHLSKGKWNYLPAIEETNDDAVPNEAYGLYKAQGHFSATNEKIHDIAFVRIDKSKAARGPFSSIRAEYVPEQDALAKIRTTPENNERYFDTIQLDRKEYQEKGKTEVTVQFETTKNVYTIQPAGKRALESLGSYFTLDLLSIVEKGIRRSNEKREFERLVRGVNTEIKEYGSPYSTTVRKFETFLSQLLEKENMEKKLEKVEGVLYYVKQF